MKALITTLLVMITAASFSKEVSLKQAIEISLKNNRNLNISRAEIKRMQSLHGLTRSANYPTVSFSTQYSRLSAIPRIATPYFSRNLGALDNYEARVSVKYLVFAWWSVTNNIRIAEIATQASRVSSSQIKEMLVYSATMSFYRVLLLKKVHETKKEAYKRDLEHYNTVEKLLRQGKASRFDLLKAKVHLENIYAQVIQSKNDYKISQNQLKLLMGLPLRETITLKGDLVAEVPGVRNQLRAALRNRNEIASLRLGSQMLRLKLKVIDAENKPKIYLFADAFLNNPYLMESKFGFNWFAGVKLEINIFDGMATKHRYNSTLRELRQNEIRLSDTIENVRSEIREVNMNLKTAREILKVRQESVKLAEEALKIAKVSFRNGVITNLDVLDSELSFLDAKLAYLSGVYNVILGEMNLRKATGTLLLKGVGNE